VISGFTVDNLGGTSPSILFLPSADGAFFVAANLGNPCGGDVFIQSNWRVSGSSTTVKSLHTADAYVLCGESIAPLPS